MRGICQIRRRADSTYPTLFYFTENVLKITNRNIQLNRKSDRLIPDGFLKSWYWIILILAMPFFGLPSPWPVVSILVVTLVWVVLWLSGEFPLIKTPLNFPILILAIMILVSTLVTYNLGISIGFVAGAVLGLVAFFTVLQFAGNPGGWWLIFFLFMAVNGFLALSVSLMVEWPQNKIELLSPLTSHLAGPLVIISLLARRPHPNLIPVFLLALLPILLVFTVHILRKRNIWITLLGSKKTNRLTLCLITFLILASLDLLASQSRSGYIAYALACISILLIASSWRIRWFLLICLLIVTWLGLSLVSGGNLAALPEYYQQTLSTDNTFSLDSFESRLEIWQRAFYGIQDFAFTGMGMGTFGYLMPSLYPLPGIRSDGLPLNAHNTYLQAGLDLGIPGLVALLWVQVASLWLWFRSWKLVNTCPDEPIQDHGFPSLFVSRFLGRPVLLGLAGVYLAYLFFGMLESFGLGVYILNWMITALIVAFYLQVRRFEEKEVNAIGSSQPVLHAPT